jgi:hypothetical protein
MNGVLPWACRSGTRDFHPALAALVGPVGPVPWAGSRARPPVFWYVSVLTYVLPPLAISCACLFV